MATENQKFGKPILQADADKMFERSKLIKDRCRDKLLEALAGDEEAIRFYVGKRIGENTFKEDTAFVFTKDSLAKIIGRIIVNEADGMVLFNAARGENDNEVNGEITDSKGRPTVIMFPFKFTKPDQALEDDEDNLTNLLDEGFEHPGTGDGDDDGTILTRSKIPQVFRPDQIHPIFAAQH